MGWFFGPSLLALMIPIYVMTACSAVVFVIFMGKALGAFPNGGGILSALIGSITMLGVSVATAMSAFLQSHSQLPMAIAYVCIGTLIWLLVRHLRADDTDSLLAVSIESVP